MIKEFRQVVPGVLPNSFACNVVTVTIDPSSATNVWVTSMWCTWRVDLADSVGSTHWFQTFGMKVLKAPVARWPSGCWCINAGKHFANVSWSTHVKSWYLLYVCRQNSNAVWYVHLATQSIWIAVMYLLRRHGCITCFAQGSGSASCVVKPSHSQNSESEHPRAV